jgi:hypothetical protein
MLEAAGDVSCLVFEIERNVDVRAQAEGSG